MRCFHFRKWLNKCGLINLEAVGPRYTWRGQDYRGFGRIYERLDRVICDVEWRDKFQEATIFNLPRVKSDHHPILLVTNTVDTTNRPNFPFRFEDVWSYHQDLKDFLRDNWKGKEKVTDKLVNLTEALKLWNKEVFGNILEERGKL